MNPLCSCSLEIEDTSLYLLHFRHLYHQQTDLMSSVKFESKSDNNKKDVLLYDDSRFDEKKNRSLLETSINYIKNSKRLSGPIFE